MLPNVRPAKYWDGRLSSGKSPQYVANHAGQLSLAIPPWVGTNHDDVLVMMTSATAGQETGSPV